MSFDQKVSEEVIIIDDERFYITDITGVNQENLSEEYSTQASRLAYIAMRVAVAEAHYQEMRAQRELTYAEADDAIRYEHEQKRDGKKPTEAAIASMIALDEEYIRAQAEEREAYKQYKILRGLVDALKDRTQMLISLGADLRQEFEATGMHINEAKNKLQAMKDG